MLLVMVINIHLLLILGPLAVGCDTWLPCTSEEYSAVSPCVQFCLVSDLSSFVVHPFARVWPVSKAAFLCWDVVQL